MRVAVAAVVVVVAACEPPLPNTPAPGGGALISLFDVDDDRRVCTAGAPGFGGFSSRDCAVDVEAGSEQTFIVENGGDAELVLERLTFVDDGELGFTLVRAPASVAVGGREDIVVSNENDASAVLRIESDAENDPVVDVALSAAEGEGEGATCIPEIGVTPATCDFGNVTIGDTAFCDISIDNVGDCELVVVDIAFSPETPSPDVFGVTGSFSLPTVVPGGAGVALRLYARPPDGLTSRGALLIEHLNGVGVAVPLRVNGI